MVVGGFVEVACFQTLVVGNVMLANLLMELQGSYSEMFDNLTFN